MIHWQKQIQEDIRTGIAKPPFSRISAATSALSDAPDKLPGKIVFVEAMTWTVALSATSSDALSLAKHVAHFCSIRQYV